jgi:hypothetical protein
MNAQRWINHFRDNKLHRTEPPWDAPIAMDPTMVARVLPSLQQFQLGDGGGPASLIAYNAERFRGKSEDIRALVDYWFAEEREHSRLLSCAVRRFGGKLIKSHWSFSAFCATRRVFGVWFELEVLLLTEIVSTGYYRVLRRHINDPAVRAMCSLILRDEAGHVAFHRARIAADPKGSGLDGLLWQCQFWLCGYAAATMLWVNHRPCLEAIGGTCAEYYAEVGFEIGRFLRQLARDAMSKPNHSLARLQPAAIVD